MGPTARCRVLYSVWRAAGITRSQLISVAFPAWTTIRILPIRLVNASTGTNCVDTTGNVYNNTSGSWALTMFRFKAFPLTRLRTGLLPAMGLAEFTRARAVMWRTRFLKSISASVTLPLASVLIHLITLPEPLGAQTLPTRRRSRAVQLPPILTAGVCVGHPEMGGTARRTLVRKGPNSMLIRLIFQYRGQHGRLFYLPGRG